MKTKQLISVKGPADVAGLLPGDVLIEIDGVPLKNKTTAESFNILSTKTLGSAVKVKALRNGAVLVKYVPVGVTPDLARFREKSREEAKRLYELGNASFEQRKFQEAISCYKRAIEYEGSFAPLFFNLGMAQMALGENGEATTNLDTYLKLRPDASNSKEVRKTIEKLKR